MTYRPKRLGLIRSLLWILIFGILSDAGFALDTAIKINQYSHTAWRSRDNGLTGSPTSITQTSNGYIWLGTINGLFSVRRHSLHEMGISRWRVPAFRHYIESIWAARMEASILALFEVWPG